MIDVAVRSTVAGETTEHVGHGTELLLQDIEFSDTGTYVCVANNSQGTVTARATLTVTGRSQTSLACLGFYRALTIWCFPKYRVATHLENLEKSGNLKVVSEKSGKMCYCMHEIWPIGSQENN